MYLGTEISCIKCLSLTQRHENGTLVYKIYSRFASFLKLALLLCETGSYYPQTQTELMCIIFLNLNCSEQIYPVIT